MGFGTFVKKLFTSDDKGAEDPELIENLDRSWYVISKVGSIVWLIALVSIVACLQSRQRWRWLEHPYGVRRTCASISGESVLQFARQFVICFLYGCLVL